MNREKEDQLPTMQVEFIDKICMPIYEAFANVSTELQPLVEGVRDNRRHWIEIATRVQEVRSKEELNRDDDNDDDNDEMKKMSRFNGSGSIITNPTNVSPAQNNNSNFVNRENNKNTEKSRQKNLVRRRSSTLQMTFEQHHENDKVPRIVGKLDYEANNTQVNLNFLSNDLMKRRNSETLVSNGAVVGAMPRPVGTTCD